MKYWKEIVHECAMKWGLDSAPEEYSIVEGFTVFEVIVLRWSSQGWSIEEAACALSLMREWPTTSRLGREIRSGRPAMPAMPATPALIMDDYQARALTTAIYPGRGEVMGLAYAALGLAGEAGEVANKVKKILRGDRPLDETAKAVISKEVGDVMWYLAAVADELGVSLGEVAESNLAKLAARAEQGTIKGDGDDRETYGLQPMGT